MDSPCKPAPPLPRSCARRTLVAIKTIRMRWAAGRLLGQAQGVLWDTRTGVCLRAHTLCYTVRARDDDVLLGSRALI